MSQPKFAPMTASLLARKGSAMPSAMSSFPLFAQMPEQPGPLKHSDLSASPPPPKPAVEAPAHREHDGVPMKKLFVTLSHPEHERLAISAVKTGISRHQIIRDALELYFEQLVQDLPHECHCVAGTSCASSC